MKGFPELNKMEGKLAMMDVYTSRSLEFHPLAPAIILTCLTSLSALRVTPSQEWSHQHTKMQRQHLVRRLADQRERNGSAENCLIS